MDRRTFLKISAMTAASASARRSPGAEETAIELRPELNWHKAPCRFCGTGCHVMVGVRNGRVVAVAGDKKAPVNKGLLCVKGYHAGMALYGDDRLTQPLLRKNGRLEPISWDEAIDVVADRITAHPDRFAFYGSGQWTIPEGYACQKFMKGGLGNNHIDPNARLCMASAVTGYVSTYGVDEPAGCYEDLDKCDVLITWGNNMAEMHPVLFSRFIDRRTRGEDVKLIDIATRATRTTEFADEFLQFQPQTDLAIINCIANLLIEDDSYDKEFVEKHCNFRADTNPASLNGRPATFDEYKKLLETYTRTYTRKLSGVASKQLSMLGDLFANPDLKIVSLWCMGFNQHTQGTAVNNLIHALHLLSGHWGRPGDGPQSLTGQPSACGTVREVGTLAHALPGGRLVANAEHRTQSEQFWNLLPGRINPTPGYHTVEMWKRFCTPTPEGGDIDTIWVQVTNPGQTLPDLHRLAEPASKLQDKFLIVSDVYPTATTELADLVLPSALWVEKNGIFGNSERRTQQWFKMVDPPGEARDDCWQVIAVARRLFDRGMAGMRDREGEFLFQLVDTEGKRVPVWDWEHYYDVNVDEQLFDEYRQFTNLKHKDLAPYA
jgi:nitrate reductase NapA